MISKFLSSKAMIADEAREIVEIDEDIAELGSEKW